MDALADLLDGPRARGAFLLRATLSPPWSVRIQDEAPLCVVAMVRDQAWITPDEDPAIEDGAVEDRAVQDGAVEDRAVQDGAVRDRAVRVGPGDVAVVRGPGHYTVADDPATTPQVVIHPGQVCTTPDGRALSGEMDLGTRTWGNDPDGSAVMLVGTYQMRGAVTRRLLAALPTLLVLRGDSWDGSLVTLLGKEIGKDEPGQEVVLDRLLDLLLIAVLRTWFSRSDAQAPGWYRAHGDPVVGPALRMLHADPAHPWTVAELAGRAGVSRAALAQRFAKLVGEPPMAYLTGLRLAQAADLLRETDATLDAVARRVGYGTAFALSSAFKREHGVSPQRYRETLSHPAG